VIHFLLYPDYRQHAKEKLKYKKVSLKITFHIKITSLFPWTSKQRNMSVLSREALTNHDPFVEANVWWVLFHFVGKTSAYFLLYPDYRQHAKEKLKYKKVSLKITFHITNEVYAEVFPTKWKSTHQTFASTNGSSVIPVSNPCCNTCVESLL
jgi:hypothetical protein